MRHIHAVSSNIAEHQPPVKLFDNSKWQLFKLSPLKFTTGYPVYKSSLPAGHCKKIKANEVLAIAKGGEFTSLAVAPLLSEMPEITVQSHLAFY